VTTLAGQRGTPFVVSAPSGTGKTSVCRRVIERDPQIEFSVSHTTREPRPGEREGVDYHFVGMEEFRALADEDAFVEYAEYGGNLYGTSWRSLDDPLARGRDLLLEIEVQGARQIRARRADARFLFLLPPSMEELARRLRKRGTDDEAQMERRLETAKLELREVHGFDYAVVNDELELAVTSVCEIIEAERAGETVSARRRFGTPGMVAKLSDQLDFGV
jgi:guanylate kinase